MMETAREMLVLAALMLTAHAVPNEARFIRLHVVPGHTEAHLEWSPMSTESLHGVITYTIYYGIGDAIESVTVPGNISSYVLTSLSPDTTYNVRIQASTIEGSFFGSTHSFTTQKYVLEAPSVRLHGVPGHTEVHLEWSPTPPESLQGVITYTIYYWAGDAIESVTVPGNIFSYVLTSLSPHTTYSTRIRVSTIKDSLLGPTFSFTTQKYDEAPLVRLRDVPGHTEAHLEWTTLPPESLQKIITYTIYYWRGADIRSVTVPGNTSSYMLTSLSPDTTYKVQIKASTIKGVFPGPTFSFTTQKYIPEPPLVRLHGVPGQTEAHLEWSPTPPKKLQEVMTYTIYYRTGDDMRSVEVLGNTSSYVLTSLSPDTTYDVQIQASTYAGYIIGPTLSFTTQRN